MIKEIIKGVNIINHQKSFFGNIEIENGLISKLEKVSEEINLEANYCLPAFIDQHTHGGYGINFDDPKMLTNENFLFLKNKLKKEGIGKIFVTTVSQSVKSLIKIGQALNLVESDLIAGWQIEGPFIDVLKKGAHDEKFITELTDQSIEEINQAYPFKKLYVIHPSDENLKVVKKYLDYKTHWFSIGHTNCSYKQAIKGLSIGCTQFTHFYNAMSPLDHRNPGAVLAGLEDKKSYIELIADNVHISNDTLLGTKEICGCQRIILVSDCLWTKGLPDGFYNLGTLPIEKIKNHCYLKGLDTLAGGAMSYLEIVKNFKKVTNVNFEEIVQVTSYNTATQFNLKNLGIIKENIPANLIILDKKLNLIKSYIQ